MPKIEIITPLDKVFCYVFFSISIMTLHCYICYMSKELKVYLEIFHKNIYSNLLLKLKLFHRKHNFQENS